MSTTIVRKTIDEAVHEHVNTQVRFQVGLVDPPETALAKPPTDQYAILSPVPAGEVYSRWCLTGVESGAELVYDVLSVGLDRRQASWVADQVRRAVCDREASTGNFIVPLIIDGYAVMDMGQAGALGTPQLESGVYQVVDSYYVKVSRDG